MLLKKTQSLKFRILENTQPFLLDTKIFKELNLFNGFDHISTKIPIIIANTYGRYAVAYSYLGPGYTFTEKIVKNRVPITKTTTLGKSIWLKRYINDIINFKEVQRSMMEKKRFFKKMNLPAVYALLMTYCYESISNQLEETVTAVNKKFIETNRARLVLNNPEFDEALNIMNLPKTEEFHPTNSILGSFLAQEIQKIVAREGRPFSGLFIHDFVSMKGEYYLPGFLLNLV
mmetsp:Transcript_28415/g.25147  ORF Transcript_28415/g.25147 Transcript_28415/m.25147 type:complete len:231 (+) Transcript_28415:331-1023(+)